MSPFDAYRRVNPSRTRRDFHERRRVARRGVGGRQGGGGGGGGGGFGDWRRGVRRRDRQLRHRLGHGGVGRQRRRCRAARVVVAQLGVGTARETDAQSPECVA